MLSFRRWLDRVTDRRPVVRITRSSYRRRRRPWLLLLGLVLLIAALLIWSQATQAPSGRLVEISTSSQGKLLLDGEPVSLEEMDARLTVLRSGTEPVFAAIGPTDPNEAEPARPTLEVEALLARHRISWMSAPIVGRAAMLGKGGDHGR